MQLTEEEQAWARYAERRASGEAKRGGADVTVCGFPLLAGEVDPEVKALIFGKD